jgi:hypothetical protein
MAAPRPRAVLFALMMILVGMSLISPVHAGALTLPRLLSTDRCVDGCARLVGVYKVRPARVELDELAGGTP